MDHSLVARFSRHCHTHGVTNAGLDPQPVSVVVRGRPGACVSFAQAAIRDISLLRLMGCIILQIVGSDLNTATCVLKQLARDILQIARE